MVIPLKTWSSRIVFLLLVGVAAVLLVAKTVRVALAGTWGDSGDVEKMQAAIALDPANPQLHYGLGNYYLQNPEQYPAEQAAGEFRTATRLNGNGSLYWEGLGHACDLAHDSSCARESLHKAMMLAPSRPQFTWEAAVFDVVSGDFQTASAELKRFLSMRPEEGEAAFQLLWRGFHDYGAIEQGLLAGLSDPGPKVAYLDFLAKNEEYDRAAVLWTALTGENVALQNVAPMSASASPQNVARPDVARAPSPAGPIASSASLSGISKTAEPSSGSFRADSLETGPFQKGPAAGGGRATSDAGATAPPLSVAQAQAIAGPRSSKPLPRVLLLPYVETLIAGNRYGQANGVWQYLRRTGQLDSPASSASAASELLYNGGFEQEPLKAGFDWRLNQQPYLALDFAEPSSHGGSHSLRVEFTVPKNNDYEPVRTLVPVIPGQPYELSAYVRSEAITSDSGPRLRVIDPRCPDCLDVSTEGTTGTTSWHRVSLRFTAGPQTDAIWVSVYRSHSRTFPMDISGQAWFDDISMKKIQNPQLAIGK